MLRDYPNRRRLEIYALAELRELKDEADLARRVAQLGNNAKVEHALLLRLKLPAAHHAALPRVRVAQGLEPVGYRILDMEGEMRAFTAASSNPVSAAGS